MNLKATNHLIFIIYKFDNTLLLKNVRIRMQQCSSSMLPTSSTMRSSKQPMPTNCYPTEIGGSNQDENGVQNGPKDLYRWNYMPCSRHYNYYLHHRNVLRDGTSYYHGEEANDQIGATSHGCPRKVLHQNSLQDYMCPNDGVRFLLSNGMQTMRTN